MKGILFKPDMIKAIVEGRKTVTRRAIKPQVDCQNCVRWRIDLPIATGAFIFTAKDGTKVNISPRYRVGEVVYIKEAHRYLQNDGDPYDFGVQYRGDSQVKWWRDNANLMDYPIDEKWRSPMFLKEIFARYFIKIKDVRVERTRDITPEDCLLEGIIFAGGCYWSAEDGVAFNTEREVYFYLYDSINGKGSHENNWDWRYEFVRTNPVG